MTCIVGIEHKGVVYLGGDSAGIGGLDIHTRLDEKVFKNDEFVMGFTSSFRMGQLLRYAFTPPDRPASKDDMAYLVTDFIDSIRSVYKEKGFMGRDTDEDAHGAEAGGTFLFGYRGVLYQVDDDFQIARTADGFMACGCGASYALGSLASTSQVSDPLERLRISLDAASHFSAGVRGPYNYVSTKHDGYIKHPIAKPSSTKRR